MFLPSDTKNRKLRSSRSSLPLGVKTPTPPPTIRRRRVKTLGFLADRDPELVGKTRVQARKINNARISKIVTQLAGIRPPLDPPHHKKHCVGGPRLCVGTDVEDFSSIGKWIQYCDPNQDGSCSRHIKFLGNGIDEDVLLNSTPLTQYLFIRKEIGPDPRSGARTINDSPLYAAARARLYGTLPLQEAPTAVTASIPQPGPSHSPKKERMEFPLTDLQSHPSMDLNLWSRSPSLYPIDFPSTGSRASGAFPQDVIEISDDESDVRPVIVFAWVKNNTRYVETILITNSDDYCFSLNDFKLDLGTRGIECHGDLEVFNPRLKQWVPLRWSERLGPVQSPFIAYFIRYKGVKTLHHFEDLLGLADGGGIPDVFPTPKFYKGKERAVH